MSGRLDLSRDSFRAHKQYTSVRLQQGRVLTDADWNEQADIVATDARRRDEDVVGRDGAPANEPGFGVSVVGGQLRVSAGRFHLAGHVCENFADFALAEQAALPGVGVPNADGTYLAYLEVFERGVTYIDDPLLRETALGGPDTAGRQLLTAQVRLLALPDAPATLTRDSEPQTYLDLIHAPRGALRARAGTVSGATVDPCVSENGGGYHLPENHLYRVEIHTGGAPGAATYKWSRNNACLAAAWLDQAGPVLFVRAPDRDRSLDFASGQWLELVDEGRELRGEPGTLVRVLRVEPASGSGGLALTLDANTATGPVDLASFPHGRRLVRRWDMSGPVGAAPISSGAWLVLEGGIEIYFDAPVGTEFRSGDAWLIPARALTRSIEWPCDQNGSLPHAVTRHFARLAFLERAGGVWSELVDCRIRFASLSDIARSDNLVANKVNRFGDTMTGTLNIEAGLNVDLDAAFGQSVAIDQNMSVGGGVEVAGALTVRGDLTVEGDVIARDTQHTPGDILLGDQDADAVTIHGVLRSEHSSGRLEIDDAARVAQDLRVDGTTSLGQDLSVSGNTILSGNALVDGRLGVGTATPAYAVDVAGTVRATHFVGDGSGLSNVGNARLRYAVLPAELYPTNIAAEHDTFDAAGRRRFYSTIAGRSPLLSPATGMFYGRRRVMLDTAIEVTTGESGPAGRSVYKIDGRDDIRLVSPRLPDVRNQNQGAFVALRGDDYGYFEITAYFSALSVYAYTGPDQGTLRCIVDGVPVAQTLDLYASVATPLRDRFLDAGSLLPAPLTLTPGLHTIQILAAGGVAAIYGLELHYERADGLAEIPEQSVVLNNEPVRLALRTPKIAPDPWSNGYGLSDTVDGYFDEGLDAWENYIMVALAVADHQAPLVYAVPLNVHDHVLNTTTGTLYRVRFLKNLVAGEHQATGSDRVVWENAGVITRTVGDITTRTDLVVNETVYSSTQQRVYRVLATTDGAHANTRFCHRRPTSGGRTTWSVHPTKRNPDDTAIVTAATTWLPPTASAMGREVVVPCVGSQPSTSFIIDGTIYVALAQYNDGSGHNMNSAIFRRGGETLIFFQNIATAGAIAVTHFTIGTDHFLAYAYHYNGSTGNINSQIFQWNGTQFVSFQALATQWAVRLVPFTAAGNTYLLSLHYYNGGTNNLSSPVYKWNGTQFVSDHSISTNGAHGGCAFTIGGDVYVAVASYFDGPSGHNVHSQLFKWNGTHLALVQALPTNGAVYAEYFQIGGDHFLAFAHQYDGDYSTQSRVFRWNGTQFDLLEALPTFGARVVRHLEIDGAHFLVFAEYHDGSTYRLPSRVYRWNGARFLEFQNLPGAGTNALATFVDGGRQYLLLAGHYLDGSYANLFGKLWRWDGERFVVAEYRNSIDERASGQSRPVFDSAAPDFRLLELARTVHAWEFGNGDANGNTSLGFDTLDGNSNRAFTLDDGLTALVGQQVRRSEYSGDASVRLGDENCSITLTFYGTGLRLRLRRDTIPRAAGGLCETGTYTIATGLPLGTHVFRITRSSVHAERAVYTLDGVTLAAGQMSLNVEAFEFWQPRAPTRPPEWVVLGGYLLPADVVQQTEGGSQNLVRGARRQHASRELFFTESGPGGTNWNLVNAAQVNDVGGLLLQSGNATKIARYRLPFFGSGFVLRFRDHPDTQNFMVRVDGSTNLLNYATSVSSGSLNPATGLFTAARSGANPADSGAALAVLGLPPGAHTVEVEATLASGRYLYVSAIDLIEPLHRADHYVPHETPYLFELRGGGAGITNDALPAFERATTQVQPFHALLSAGRPKWPRGWANISKTDGAGVSDGAPWRCNVLRGLLNSEHFGVKGVVYGRTAGAFVIRESGTYEISLNVLGNLSGSLGVFVNDMPVQSIYSNYANIHASAATTRILHLREGDRVQVRVNSGGFYHSTFHNNVNLKLLE